MSLGSFTDPSSFPKGDTWAKHQHPADYQLVDHEVAKFLFLCGTIWDMGGCRE